MTRDDVIRMAQEAASQHGHKIKPTDQIVETLTSFAALVAAHEREECAKLCEVLYEQDQESWSRYMRTAHDCAKAIRARGEQ